MIWLLRGGLLLSSLLSLSPPGMQWIRWDWRGQNSEEDGEDDPLENLFGRAKAASPRAITARDGVGYVPVDPLRRKSAPA